MHRSRGGGAPRRPPDECQAQFFDNNLGDIGIVRQQPIMSDQQLAQQQQIAYAQAKAKEEEQAQEAAPEVPEFVKPEKEKSPDSVEQLDKEE